MYVNPLDPHTYNRIKVIVFANSFLISNIYVYYLLFGMNFYSEVQNYSICNHNKLSVYNYLFVCKTAC